MQLERKIEKEIIEYLRLRGALAQKVRTTGRSVANRFIPLPKDELGVADVLCCYKGRFYAIEVKAPKGKQSENQKLFQLRVERAGGVYILARNIDDLKIMFE